MADFPPVSWVRGVVGTGLALGTPICQQVGRVGCNAPLTIRLYGVCIIVSPTLIHGAFFCANAPARRKCVWSANHACTTGEGGWRWLQGEPYLWRRFLFWPVPQQPERYVERPFLDLDLIADVFNAGGRLDWLALFQFERP